MRTWQRRARRNRTAKASLVTPLAALLGFAGIGPATAASSPADSTGSVPPTNCAAPVPATPSAAQLAACGYSITPLTSISPLPDGGSKYIYGDDTTEEFVPPADFNPITATQAELYTYGFPARPDVSAADYQGWNNVYGKLAHVDPAPPFLFSNPSARINTVPALTATARLAAQKAGTKRVKQIEALLANSRALIALQNQARKHPPVVAHVNSNQGDCIVNGSVACYAGYDDVSSGGYFFTAVQGAYYEPTIGPTRCTDNGTFYWLGLGDGNTVSNELGQAGTAQGDTTMPNDEAFWESTADQNAVQSEGNTIPQGDALIVSAQFVFGGTNGRNAYRFTWYDNTTHTSLPNLIFYTNSFSGHTAEGKVEAVNDGVSTSKPLINFGNNMGFDFMQDNFLELGFDQFGYWSVYNQISAKYEIQRGLSGFTLASTSALSQKNNSSWWTVSQQSCN